MKKRLLSLILVISLILLFSACTDTENTEKSSAIYYCLGDSDTITDFIDKYNKNCSLHGDKNDMIEVRHFESEEEFISITSTEIMAGNGPDFFCLNQTLPFEKFIENDTLADIDGMIEEYDSGINFDDYNKTVMDSGVFNGKRLIVPFFFSVNFLYSTKDRTEAINIDPKTITYNELSRLKSSSKYDFVYAEESEKLSCFICTINQFVDFKEKKTYFDTDEFSSAVDIMTDLFNNNGQTVTDYFFDNPKLLTKNPFDLTGGSVEAIARAYCVQQTEDKELVIFPTYSRGGKISAYMQTAIAVNNNSDKKEQVMKFIEFVLSDKQQAYYYGALRKERMYSGGIVALPVKNSALDDALEVELTDVFDIEDDGITTDKEAIINKNKVDFLNNEFIPMLNSVEECSVYDYRWLEQSYYSKNVIYEIVNNYLNGEITKSKFITQLETATQIYMME